MIKPGDELYYNYEGELGALLDKKLKEGRINASGDQKKQKRRKKSKRACNTEHMK